MAFEVFRNDNGDDEVKDAAKADMPEIAGDINQLRTFRPTGESGDVMPPLPAELSAEDLIAEYERKQAEKRNGAE